MVNQSSFITAEGYIFDVECYSEEYIGFHEIKTCSATTEEQAIRNWNAAIKKWQKQREKVISEKAANVARKNK